MTSGRQGSFGQRGLSTNAAVVTAPLAEPAGVAGEADEREPGLLTSLFGIGDGEDEFDIRLSEEYEPVTSFNDDHPTQSLGLCASYALAVCNLTS